MTNEDKAELRRLCLAGDNRRDDILAAICDCSVATVKRYRRVFKSSWYIDRKRGVSGFPFALCAPYRDKLPGTAVLACFAYRPHAEYALEAVRAFEEAGKSK